MFGIGVAALLTFFSGRGQSEELLVTAEKDPKQIPWDPLHSGARLWGVAR